MSSEFGCRCTGIRSCSLCEKQTFSNDLQSTTCHWYCPTCHQIFAGCLDDHVSEFGNTDWCRRHVGKLSSMNISGIDVKQEFIDSKEEEVLLEEINKQDWKLSQSGRRKQDYGPKANFKRKKVKTGAFTGLPSYSKFLVERMKEHEWLLNFCPVELCNLEYTPARGSSIDPHIDDVWLWGDVLVTVNLKSHTILTLTDKPLKLTSLSNENNHDNAHAECIAIQIPLPRRSLVLLAKEARYQWLHSISRRHIRDYRYAMTFRNLSGEFSVGGEQHEVGQSLVDIANTFAGKIVP